MPAARFGLEDALGARFLLASAGGAGALAAREAVALIDGTLVADVTLAQAEAAVALDDGAAPAVILALDGADDAAVQDALAALVPSALARGCPVVVAMTVAQIDPVIAALPEDAPAIQLLCDPDQAEWISALAMAAVRDDGRLASGDDESERQARLNAEVARIAALLAQIARRAGPGAGGARDRHMTFGAADGAPRALPAANAVRDVLRARRLRDRFFGAALFEDPAWDMLLDLFAARLEGTRVSVSSLCIASAVAPTTALRWIAKLTAARLLERRPDPDDRRRAFIALSDEAAIAMERYVAALAEARLPLV
ncbi:MAG: winged helix DNA-binding protein [Sphingomonas adhaesiva]|uniref:winged helix DNA-binding protein n=1 Tax=Sphingomonas adhaesiva TaxID=28212 RepID=UPI002FF820D3